LCLSRLAPCHNGSSFSAGSTLDPKSSKESNAPAAAAN
jgi:hypothetical protein